MIANSKIPRFDPNWDERVQQMELHPQGDYVEFSDHETVVAKLEARINQLQTAVNEVFEALRGEAS